MKYLILTIPSIEYAKAISFFLYALSIPELNQSTKYYNQWNVHPENNNVCLSFPDVPILINENANEKELVDLVRSAVSEEEAIKLENDIKNNKGQEVYPLDFIPQSISSNIITEEEFINNGWINLEL